MRNKRILAMLMTVTLLTGTVGYLGEQTQAAAVEPEVMISGVKVTEDGTETGKATGYLEVSLEVQAENFQTAGVVLSYDTGVLTLVDWKDPAEAPELTENWTTVIPSKGADRFSGKPALGRLEESGEAGTEEGAGARGYLYLGADSLRYQDLSTEAERLATVRFQIKKDAEGDYLPVNVPGAGESLTNPNKTLCLAPEGVAEEAIPGAQVMLSVGVPEEEVTDGSELNPIEGYVQKYYAWRSTESKYAENDETACKVSFRVGPGKSINTGGEEIVGGGGKAITFFDWDGRAIDAVSADDGNAAAVIEAWEDAHEDRLTNKPGYAFDCWLVVYENNDGKGLVTKNETFTSNDEKLDRTNPDISEDIAKPSELFKDGNSVFLQAAYYAKTTANGFTDDLVNGGKTDNTDRYYTISEPVYTRYGAADAVAGSYSLTMTVTRLQEDGNTGVTRLREPAIWVAMTPAGGGANIMNLIRLENTDTTTFEVVTTKQIASVTYKVIDVYGISNWPGCADRSDVTKGARNRNTCITLGTQGYLAEQAYNVYQGGTWESTVNNWAFADCYYNNGTQSGKAAATWWNDTRCNTAKSRLLTATQAKGAKLTYAEVVTALNGVT